MIPNKHTRAQRLALHAPPGMLLKRAAGIATRLRPRHPEPADPAYLVQILPLRPALSAIAKSVRQYIRQN